MNNYWGTKCTLDRLTHLFDDYIIYKYPERLEANGEPECQKKFTKTAGQMISLLSAKKSSVCLPNEESPGFRD